MGPLLVGSSKAWVPSAIQLSTSEPQSRIMALTRSAFDTVVRWSRLAVMARTRGQCRHGFILLKAQVPT